MKVLFTHELFLPDCAGGGELSTYEMVRILKEKGIDVTVLTTGNSKLKEYKSIKTVRLPINRYLMNFSGYWIKKYAKDFDIIQTNNYNACYASWKAGKALKKPVVCIVHGMYGNQWLKMRGPLFGRLSKAVEKFQIKRDYDKIIFFSDYARKEGLEYGIPKYITKIINPGIPRSFSSFKIEKKEKFVLFVGRISKQKGLDYLMEAAKQLPDIKFKLAGRGEEMERLKKLAPSNVEFLGFVPDNELISLYSRALIFCLPSVGEGFGYVLIEAMASGCAIVSTVPLKYEGKTIEIGNVSQLKDSIEYLVNNQKLAEAMGLKNRKMAKDYSWEKFVDGLIKIYKELI